MTCNLANQGELKTLAVVQSRQETDDGAGGQTLTGWADVVTLWCKMEQISAGEQYARQQMNSTATHRFLARYRAGVLASHRIYARGRYFNIRSVENVGEGDTWLRITAEEGVPL